MSSRNLEAPLSSSTTILIPGTPTSNPNQDTVTNIPLPFTNAMVHLLGNLLNIAPSSTVYKALVYGEVFIPAKFSALNHKSISEMTYETPEMDCPLNAPQRLILTQAVAWMRLQCTQHDKPLLTSGWITFTSNDFEEYINSLIKEDEDYDMATSLPPTTNYLSTSSSASAFQKGIKCDVSQYSSFKEDSFWDVCHHDLLDKDHTHGISEVFDPNYMPQDDVAKELFAVKQTFVYSVFVRHILTASGKNIVREFSKTGDTQPIYRHLLSRYTDSPEAKSNAHKLAVLHFDDTWHSTTSALLNHWHLLYLQLEDITNPEGHSTSSQKKAKLKNAVAPHAELARIVQLECLQVQSGNKGLDYDKYLALLDSAASDYDCSHQKPTSHCSVNKANRKNKANQSTQKATGNQSNNNNYNNNKSNSNKYSSPSTTRTKPSGIISLPSEAWNALSQEQQAAIIGCNHTLPQTTPCSTNASTATQANTVPSVVNTHQLLQLPLHLCSLPLQVSLVESPTSHHLNQLIFAMSCPPIKPQPLKIPSWSMDVLEYQGWYGMMASPAHIVL